MSMKDRLNLHLILKKKFKDYNKDLKNNLVSQIVNRIAIIGR